MSALGSSWVASLLCASNLAAHAHLHTANNAKGEVAASMNVKAAVACMRTQLASASNVRAANAVHAQQQQQQAAAASSSSS